MLDSDSEFAETDWTSKACGKFLIYSGKCSKQGLSRNFVARYVRRKRAWGAMWSYDFDYAQAGPWYKCICDTANYDIDRISSANSRSKVRRSLKRCSVRPVTYVWLADNGYETYLNASQRYNNFAPITKENFRQMMRSYANVGGRQALGVFVQEALAAYATLFVCGSTVYTYALKFDPTYAQSYPMYALLYFICHHYLATKSYKQIDNGTRPLLHETDISDFLLHLGWRKQYCRLALYLRPDVRAALFIARLLRKRLNWLLPSRYFVIVRSLLEAEDMAKATREN